MRALRIPALSEGWQGSFRELLEQAGDGDRPAAPAPALAWQGLEAAARGVDPPRARRDLGPARPTDGFEAAQRAAAGPVPDRARAPDPASAAAAAHLLAVGTSEHRELPHQRQARAPRRRPAATSTRHLRVGDVLEAGAPRGAFVLRASPGRWC